MREGVRHEIKMVCEERAHAWVLTALRSYHGALRTMYPERRVQSIYLDTPDGRSLEENLAGISRRSKIRFRWYGDEADLVRGRLEMKERENTLGWKHTAEIDGHVAVEGCDRVSFMQVLSNRAPAPWRLRLQSGLEVVQWIAYTRQYLATADGTVRVTLDRELRTADQRYRFDISMGCPSVVPRILVVEAKCSPEHYQRAEEMINSLPLVVDKCSKFVIASGPRHGPLVSMVDRF